MLDIRQTPEYANYLSQTGWIIEQVNSVNYFIKRLPLIGSLIKIQRPEKIDNNSIIQLSKMYRAFQIIIEPKNLNDELRITNYGFKKTKSPFLPSKTLHLDLKKSEEKLLERMKKDARSALRGVSNIELKKIENKDQTEEFRQAWKKAVGWKRYVPPLDHLIALKGSFGENAFFLTSGNSGAIFLIADGVGYYWQAFTDKEGREQQIQYKIVWAGILWAKRLGAKVFDFEGIYDERFPNKSWLGFTHFKKSFGGYEVTYPGAFVKNLLPFNLWT